MIKKLLCLSAFVLFASSAFAQGVPYGSVPYGGGVVAAPLIVPVTKATPNHWYKDKKFWIGVGVIGLSVFADQYSSSWMEHRGGYEVGPASLIVGNHPSDGEIAGFGIGEFASQVGLYALTWHCEQNALGFKGLFHCYGKNQDNGKHRKFWSTVQYFAIPSAVAGDDLTDAARNFYRFDNLPRSR